MVEKDDRKRQAPSRPKKRSKPTRSPREIPNKASVIGTDTLVAPGGHRYEVLVTDQVDEYEEGKQAKKDAR